MWPRKLPMPSFPFRLATAQLQGDRGYTGPTCVSSSSDLGTRPPPASATAQLQGDRRYTGPTCVSSSSDLGTRPSPASISSWLRLSYRVTRGTQAQHAFRPHPTKGRDPVKLLLFPVGHGPLPGYTGPTRFSSSSEGLDTQSGVPGSPEEKVRR